MSVSLEDWEKRLAHDKHVRDGYVLCGNPAPTIQDKPGSMVMVTPRKFVGKTFWAHMGTAHDSIDYASCVCRKG